MHQGADGVGGGVHVDAGRVGVLADGVELITVSDSDVSKTLEISFFYCFNNGVSSVTIPVTHSLTHTVSYLGGTEYSALYLSSSLVFTLFLIPTELEVFFCMSEATQMRTLMPGQ